MRELFVNSSRTRDEVGTPVHFDYYILIGEVDTGPFSCESYGVKVVRPETEESCSVPNITTSVSRIDTLMELLVSNTVTPVNLRDVLEDWL